MFQDSSAAAARLSEFLPNNQHQSIPQSSFNPPSRTQSQESWGQHNQVPMRTQYTTLPPFAGTNVNTAHDQYLLSNQNPPPRHQPQPENLPRRQPASFAIPPLDQHHHFQQNMESVQHRAPMPQAQAPPTTMNDYMSTGNPNRNTNGWELPATNENPMAGSWNQSHHAPVASVPQQSTFQPQATPPPPLSNNPFQSQTPNIPFGTTQPTQNRNSVASSYAQKQEDSQMVDDLFASLGTADSDESGLLNALNSVTLGGAASQQQANWGSKFSGWSGEDSSSIFGGSRLGDYREER